MSPTSILALADGLRDTVSHENQPYRSAHRGQLPRNKCRSIANCYPDREMSVISTYLNDMICHPFGKTWYNLLQTKFDSSSFSHSWDMDAVPCPQKIKRVTWRNHVFFRDASSSIGWDYLRSTCIPNLKSVFIHYRCTVWVSLAAECLARSGPSGEGGCKPNSHNSCDKAHCF